MAQPSIRRQVFRSIVLTTAAALALVSIPSILLTAFAVNQHLDLSLRKEADYLRSWFNRSRLMKRVEREQVLAEQLTDLSAGGDLYWIEKASGAKTLPEQSERLPDAVTATTGSLHQSLSEAHWAASLAFFDPRKMVRNRSGELFELRRVGPLDYNKDLWVARDFNLFSAFFYNYFILTLVTWLVVLLAASLVAWLLANRLIRPIQVINDHAQQASPERLELLSDRIAEAPQELQQLASGFDALMVRLASTWASQNAFSRQVSHELRTPLTLVKGYLGRALRRADALPEPVLDSIQVAAEETDRTIALVADLLELSRGQMGRLELRDKPTDLQRLLPQITTKMQTALNHAVMLTLDPQLLDAAGSCWVELDPERLEQVLVNLLENAHKYSAITKPIALSVALEHNTLVFRVRDQGIGVPLQDQENLFDPFIRASNARAQADGSGLGLAVCRLMVQAMGGSIALEDSALGRGSCFRVQLPRKLVAALN